MKATSRSLGRLVRGGAGLVLILSLLVGCIAPAAPPERSGSLGPRSTPQPAESSTSVRQLLASPPLLFEENRGQTNASVGFLARGPAMTAFFTPEGVTYRLFGWDQEAAAEFQAASVDPTALRTLREESPPASWLLQHDLVGGRVAHPAAREQAETVVSYFKGQPDAWITGVPTYGELTYAQTWPGIDVVYRTDGPQLKSGYVVDAGADPGLIQLRYRGGVATVTERGELEITTGLGVLRERAPVAWQETADSREPVAVHFRLLGQPEDDIVEYGFALGTYDQSRPLIIDPVIEFVGYVGGTALDEMTSMTTDASGAAYATGKVQSDAASFEPFSGPDLTLNGVDGFVVKVNPAGTAMVYRGYIGGDGVLDSGESIGVAPNCASDCDAYVAGYTDSATNFPVSGSIDGSPNGFTDAFALKVNANGTALLWSGFVGGTTYDQGFGIAVDDLGDAYITGKTSSSEVAPGGGHGFPNGDGAVSLPAVGGFDQTMNGTWENAFVAKLDSTTGALEYWSYLGATSSLTYGAYIAVDSTRRAVVAGFTTANETIFPNDAGIAALGSVNGFDQSHNGTGSGPAGQDVFVLRLTANGTAVDYLTYIGGDAQDTEPSVTVDGSGAIYVAGATKSKQATFPNGGGMAALNKPGFDKTHDTTGFTGFAVKLLGTASGSTDLAWATYLGGSLYDEANAVAVQRGCTATCPATVGGGTGSSNFNGIAGVGSPDSTYSSGFNGWVAQVAADGTYLVFGTYVGGASTNTVQVYGLSVLTSGRVIVGGHTDATQAQFPTDSGIGSIPTFDGTRAGNSDAFIMGLSAPPTVTPTPSPTPSPTVTMTLTPTPNVTSTPVPTSTVITAVCAPRPPVSITSRAVGPNLLLVTVSSSEQPATPGNRLVALHFKTFANGVVDVPNGPTNQSSAFTHWIPSTTTTTASFYVRRPNPSAATTVGLAVQDVCSTQWQTFVGGGAGAF